MSAVGNLQWEIVIPLAEQPDGWENKYDARKNSGTGNPWGFRHVFMVPSDASGTFDPYPKVDFNNLLFYAGT
jgi:hypothetical protein